MKDRVFLVAVPLEVGGLQEILGSPVIFTGVGKINAASAAHHAVAQGFRKIVNIGSCGSLSIPVGQVVQIGRAIQDIDATPLCGYGETPFEDDSMECYAQAKVCRSLGASYQSYKWVSDSGDGSDWQANCRSGFEIVKELLAVKVP
ncbi:MAG: hypothetical protein EBS96_08755 [Spartobacteria bacterium]|nr:hypothetical protein [Spartobacteria bacterium]